MTEQQSLLDALESARGFVDGMIADVLGARNSADALDFITEARRLRLKSLHVLDETVAYAAVKDARWEDVASRYGQTTDELKARYPDIVEAQDDRRRRLRDQPQW